jgi:hypothetical protein
MMDVQNSWMTVSPWSTCTHARLTRENFGDESSLDTLTKGAVQRGHGGGVALQAKHPFPLTKVPTTILLPSGPLSCLHNTIIIRFAIVIYMPLDS